MEQAIGNEAIGFALVDTARLFRRALDKRAREIGMTGMQWRLLAYLVRNEGINQGGLAELLDIEPMTLSRMADRMQESGLVERRPDPNDRRAWRLYSTDKSKPLILKCRGMAMEVMDAMMDGLDEAERDALTDTIELLRSNLTGRGDTVEAQGADYDMTKTG